MGGKKGIQSIHYIIVSHTCHAMPILFIFLYFFFFFFFPFSMPQQPDMVRTRLLLARSRSACICSHGSWYLIECDDDELNVCFNYFLFMLRCFNYFPNSTAILMLRLKGLLSNCPYPCPPSFHGRKKRK